MRRLCTWVRRASRAAASAIASIDTSAAAAVAKVTGDAAGAQAPNGLTASNRAKLAAKQMPPLSATTRQSRQAAVREKALLMMVPRPGSNVFPNPFFCS
jgi:hypothetical protein